jgi:hypothetical protein
MPTKLTPAEMKQFVGDHSQANHKEIDPAFTFLASLLAPDAFLITPTPLKLHKSLPPAASFKQLYRTRP